MGIFQDGLIQLEELGVLDVIVPFILVFTIVFAVLQKTKVLGTEVDGKTPKKNFNAVIALVMALGVIIPHVTGTYPDGSDVVTIINNALPNVSAVLIAVVMMLLMIGVFGGEVNFAGTSVAGWAVAFAVGATVIIFGSAAQWWNLPDWLSFLNDSDTQALIFVVLIFGLLISWIMSDSKEKKDAEKLDRRLGEVMRVPK